MFSGTAVENNYKDLKSKKKKETFVILSPVKHKLSPISVITFLKSNWMTIEQKRGNWSPNKIRFQIVRRVLSISLHFSLFRR